MPLADQVTPGQLKQGLLYPPQSDILETEIKVAARVAKVVFDTKLARVSAIVEFSDGHSGLTSGDQLCGIDVRSH